MISRKKNPSILFVVTGLNMGGAERALYNMVACGINEKYDCLIITLHSVGFWGAKFQHLGIKVLSFNLSCPSSFVKSTLEIFQEIRTKKFELIQGWMYHGNSTALILKCFVAGCPKLFWSIRQTLYDVNNEKFMTKIVISMNNFFSSRPDAIIYNSSLSKHQHERQGFSDKNSYVIANGFDPKSLSRKIYSTQFKRDELEVVEGDVVIGHVARVHPMKDHSTFINVALKVVKTYSNVKILMVGKGVPNYCSSLIPLEYQNKFLLFDETEEVYSFMSSMDIFCLSSAWGEGFPNVLAEAMLLEIPCVSTDVGDSERILNGNGFLVPAKDIEAMETAIIKLLKYSKVQRKKIGRKSRENIVENYDLAGQIEKLEILWDCK